MSEAARPLVLSVFSTFAVGGPQVRFATLANHFGPAYRHAVIAMDGRLDCAERLSPGLEVSYPTIGFRKGATLANAWRFRRALRDLRPDVLVTSNWGTIEWAMANAWPLVRHIHVEDGFGPEERASQLPRRVWLRRALLRRCTVVVPSRTLWRIATEAWRLPERRMRLVPNGIDLARFGQARDSKPNGAPPVIGTVAALRPEKNLGRLLRAFALLPEGCQARLVIAGDGPERAALEALARELGVAARVRFTGHVADPARLYGGFDLFALSSDTEQMPLTVLEAMAAGLPVVATEVGDVRAMLCPENGPFVGPKEAAALAERLRDLLADAALRQRIGATNRAKAEQDYDEQGMFHAWRALFDGTS